MLFEVLIQPLSLFIAFWDDSEGLVAGEIYEPFSWDDFYAVGGFCKQTVICLVGVCYKGVAALRFSIAGNSKLKRKGQHKE